MFLCCSVQSVLALLLSLFLLSWLALFAFFTSSPTFTFFSCPPCFIFSHIPLFSSAYFCAKLTFSSFLSAFLWLMCFLSLYACHSSAALCFCSCLFPNLLMIAKPLTSSPPIKAWASPLPILLSIALVSTLVPLLPALILGPIGRWVWEDGKEYFFRSLVSTFRMSTIAYKKSLWENRDLKKKL